MCMLLDMHGAAFENVGGIDETWCSSLPPPPTQALLVICTNALSATCWIPMHRTKMMLPLFGCFVVVSGGVAISVLLFPSEDRTFFGQ